MALRTMRNALIATGGDLTAAAILVGFAGASSLWRIAYAVPRVMRMIRKYGRRPWDAPRKKGMQNAKSN